MTDMQYPQHKNNFNGLDAILATYAAAVRRTGAVHEYPASEQIGPIGLAAEAGELLDLFKKKWFHGHAYDRAKTVKELGDVAWYLQHTLTAMGLSWEEVLNTNVAKLEARYPNGFSTIDSQIRADLLGGLTHTEGSVSAGDRTGRDI